MAAHPPPGSGDGQLRRLTAILCAAGPLMEALRVAREVDAPDWLIAGGAIRDPVWDALHGRIAVVPRDIDVAFFDPGDLTRARDADVQDALARRSPHLPLKAKNQAAVHLWYPAHFGRWVSPLGSSAEGVSTFPEIASCVGVRLTGDDELHVVAPHGLDELLAGVCRHNPARVSPAFYRERVAAKGWLERWPRLQILDPAPVRD